MADNNEPPPPAVETPRANRVEHRSLPTAATAKQQAEGMKLAAAFRKLEEKSASFKEAVKNKTKNKIWPLIKLFNDKDLDEGGQIYNLLSAMVLQKFGGKIKGDAYTRMFAVAKDAFKEFYTTKRGNVVKNFMSAMLRKYRNTHLTMSFAR